MNGVNGWLRQRYEIKYILAHGAVPRLLARLSQYMKPDPNKSPGNDGYFNRSIGNDFIAIHIGLSATAGLPNM